MDSKLKIQKLKILFIPVFIAGLLSSVPVFAQDRASKDPKAEFEAMKAEWEKVRDQQIAMIQEKEAQLEELKEELFRKMNAGKDAAAVPKDAVTMDKSIPDETVLISKTAVLEKKIADLKEANRVLANEVSTLKAGTFELEEKLKTAPGGSGPVVSERLQKEKAGLEAQKAAFLKERQKFFQEISRQRAKLRESQGLPEEGKNAADGKDRADLSAI